MPKQRKPKRVALEYCFICLTRLDAATGRVLLRPLKDTGVRAAIPLTDRRVTMCSNDATTAVDSGDYEVVEDTPDRITS